MTKTLCAVFDGKVLRPKEPVVGLKVNRDYVLSIDLKEEDKMVKGGSLDSAFNLSSLAVKTGICDLASEHDHYLYGNLKRGDGNAR